jgi:hypothetical protein
MSFAWATLLAWYTYPIIFFCFRSFVTSEILSIWSRQKSLVFVKQPKMAMRERERERERVCVCVCARAQQSKICNQIGTRGLLWHYWYLYLRIQWRDSNKQFSALISWAAFHPFWLPECSWTTKDVQLLEPTICKHLYFKRWDSRDEKINSVTIINICSSKK